jgi:hypothetical protein
LMDSLGFSFNKEASAQECFHCRAKVLLAREPSEFRSSGEAFLRPNKWCTAVLQQAGVWRFFEIDLSAVPKQPADSGAGREDGAGAEAETAAQVVGFTLVIRLVSRANEALGRTATLTVACQRRDQGYPLANAGRSNAERSQRASPSGASGGTMVVGEHGEDAEEREWQDHRVLSRQSCSECVLSFNPGEIVRGRDLKWRLGVMSETAKTVLALAHVGPFALQEFVTSHFDQASFDAFRVKIMPEKTGAATKFVLGKHTVPVSNNDEFFPGWACNGCHAVVQSRANLTGTWNIVVRGGSFGGAFSVVLQLLRTCPHSCSGNAICMRRNTYA